MVGRVHVVLLLTTWKIKIILFFYNSRECTGFKLPVSSTVYNIFLRGNIFASASIWLDDGPSPFFWSLDCFLILELVVRAQMRCACLIVCLKLFRWFYLNVLWCAVLSVPPWWWFYKNYYGCWLPIYISTLSSAGIRHPTVSIVLLRRTTLYMHWNLYMYMYSTRTSTSRILRARNRHG